MSTNSSLFFTDKENRGVSSVYNVLASIKIVSKEKPYAVTDKSLEIVSNGNPLPHNIFIIKAAIYKR